ncbi:MAG: methionine adenosyltransferase [Gammaproteobacteria bacterium]
MTAENIFTSESVTRGHPDKLCDQISDAIVDHYLAEDPTSRLVAECAVSSGVIFLSVRVASDVNLDMTDIARRVVSSAGYHQGEFNDRDCSVMLSQADLASFRHPRLDVMSADLEELARIPASHQATLFGYACRQTASLMPLPIVLANAIARRLTEARELKVMSYLAPDGQVQVAVSYQHRQPLDVHCISMLTTQLTADTPSTDALRSDLIERVINPVLDEYSLQLNQHTRLIINPDGPIIGGGPAAHSGLTGRKIGIDTYGEYSRQSGAALSGKDPLRIDRIGAYAARYAAKHVVAAGLAEECEVQLSYTVGQPEPVSLRVYSYGTGKLDDTLIAQTLDRVFDFRPGMIAREFSLQQLPREHRGFYQNLAVFGHMGREDLDAPWERLTRLQEMKNA